MSITVGVDSWTTVAEADEFLEGWVGSGIWFDLPETDPVEGSESKENYLKTSYWWLKSMYDVPASANAPDDLKMGQSYGALWLIDSKKEYEKRDALVASGVEDFSWSRWREKLTGVTAPRLIDDIFIGLNLAGWNTSVQLYGEDYER